MSDAFVIMLLELRAGAQALVYNATDNRGTNVTVTYNLTIQ